MKLNTRLAQSFGASVYQAELAKACEGNALGPLAAALGWESDGAGAEKGSSRAMRRAHMASRSLVL